MTLNSRRETSLPAIAPGPGSYYQTPTMQQERDMRKLSQQVVKLVKTRGGSSQSAPEVMGGAGRSRVIPRARSQASFEAIAEAGGELFAQDF